MRKQMAPKEENYPSIHCKEDFPKIVEIDPNLFRQSKAISQVPKIFYFYWFFSL